MLSFFFIVAFENKVQNAVIHYFMIELLTQRKSDCESIWPEGNIVQIDNN